jgi:large subunit ribosomal protein L1
MGCLTKRGKKIASMVDTTKTFSVEQALGSLKECPPVKFDESIDVSLKLGVDSRKSDQNVRGTVSLPSGTGKKMIVVALARGDKLAEAQAAGADFAGNDDLVTQIAGGWTNFDVLVVTPDMMRDVGKLGKVLGPRGLMPTPKTGTVTTEIGKAIKEVKQGKIEFKSDKFGVVNCAVGKISFTVQQLKDNVGSLLSAVVRSRPQSVKGNFIQSVYLSSTMGPGLKVDMREFETTAKG